MPESQHKMVDNSSVMSPADISNLKDTLCAQQKLLQQLYNELDAEREASATAASEALSVILRLQGEKAAVKMEAEQFKRLAEEKMCHAEESFAIIEDIIYQKEMEVADLHYQVQSYRYKLVTMGALDPGVGEIKLPENLMQRNENLDGDQGHPHSLKNLGRRNSLPVMFKSKKALTERESNSSDMDLVCKNIDELTNQEINDLVVGPEPDRKTDSSTRAGISLYGEEIRELDMRVKEIAGASYTSSRNENVSMPTSSLLTSRLSAGNLSLSTNLHSRTRPTSPQAEPIKVDHIKLPPIPVKKGSAAVVHDVFEVPQPEAWIKERKGISRQASEGNIFKGISRQASEGSLLHPESGKLYAKNEPDWLKKLLQSNNREKNFKGISRQASEGSLLHPESGKLHAKDEPDWLKKLLQSNNREKNLKGISRQASEGSLLHPESGKLYAKDEPDWLKKLLQSNNHEKNLLKPSDIAAMERGIVPPTTTSGESHQPTSNQVDKSSEMSEVYQKLAEMSEAYQKLAEMSEVYQKLAEMSEVHQKLAEMIEVYQQLAESTFKREEELELLREIKQNLNLVHDEITSQKVMMRPSIREKKPSSPFSEAILSFWL